MRCATQRVRTGFDAVLGGLPPALLLMTTPTTLEESLMHSPDMYSFDPLAEIFPLLEGLPFEELTADVRAHGVREPIWLREGKILDGRNRWRAAQSAQVDCPTREYTGNDPIGFVVSMNLHRRQLNESQRAVIAAKIASLSPGRPPENPEKKGVSEEKAAQMLNVSTDSVTKARKVMRKAEPEVVQAIERGDVRVGAAAKILDAPRDEQVEAVKAGKRGVRTLAKKQRAARVDPKQERARELAEKRDKMVQGVWALINGVTQKSLTVQQLVSRVHFRWFRPKEQLMRFMQACSKVAVREDRVERRREAKRRKAFRVFRAKERATARRIQAQATANRAAAKKAARKVASKNAKTASRVRTANARHAVRRAGRRAGDGKGRRSAKPGLTRVTRRSNHPSVSA